MCVRVGGGGKGERGNASELELGPEKSKLFRLLKQMKDKGGAAPLPFTSTWGEVTAGAAMPTHPGASVSGHTTTWYDACVSKRTMPCWPTTVGARAQPATAIATPKASGREA